MERFNNIKKGLLVLSVPLITSTTNPEQNNNSNNNPNKTPTHSGQSIKIKQDTATKLNSTSGPMVSHAVLDTQILYTTKAESQSPDTTAHVHNDTTQTKTINTESVVTKSEEVHKDIKPEKIEAPKPESVSMGIPEFTNALKDMIVTSMNEKDTSSTLNEMHIQKEGDHLAFDALITSSSILGKYDIKVTGKIIQSGDSLLVSDQTTIDVWKSGKVEAKANFIVKGKAENKILKLLKNMKFAKGISKKTGKEIQSMKIEENGVNVHFKG